MARLGEPERQRRYLDRLRQHSAALPWVDVVIVIGSLASGQADGISDVDLLIGVKEQVFDQAWSDRARLRVTGTVRSWDHWLDEANGAGTHKWLSRPPISRDELGAGALHPVEAAYDEFKARLRLSDDHGSHGQVGIG